VPVVAQIGQCIYCHATNDLRDEHIVPFALGGQWVLGKASCPACADKTSAFEGDVLRGELLMARSALGIKTRHAKDRPTRKKAVLIRDSQPLELDLPVNQAVVELPLMEFEMPAYLSGRRYASGISVKGIRVYNVGQITPEELVREHGASGLQLTISNKAVSFGRMIAKIAYTYTVASCGLDALEVVYVLPALVGDVDDIGMWVGSEVSGPRGSLRLNQHRLALKTINRDVICGIQLFGTSSLKYLCVVGHLAPGKTIPAEAPLAMRSSL